MWEPNLLSHWDSRAPDEVPAGYTDVVKREWFVIRNRRSSQYLLLTFGILMDSIKQ
jgi:hypothetical protein